MVHLALRLIGSFEARTASGKPIALPSKKAKALLAYLALHADQPQSRDKLAALLWGTKSDSAARANLRQTVSSLRKALPETCQPALSFDAVALNAHGLALDLDVETFLHLAESDTEDAVDKALALYRDELLDDVAVKEPAFDEWLREARHDLREHAVRLFSRALKRLDETGDSDRAIAVAKRLLSIEPYGESVHRALMRLYARAGRHGDALAHYATCRELLQRELGVAPEPATEAHREATLETSTVDACTKPPLGGGSRRDRRSARRVCG